MELKAFSGLLEKEPWYLAGLDLNCLCHKPLISTSLIKIWIKDTVKIFPLFSFSFLSFQKRDGEGCSLLCGFVWECIFMVNFYLEATPLIFFLAVARLFFPLFSPTFFPNALALENVSLLRWDTVNSQKEIRGWAGVIADIRYLLFTTLFIV